MFFKDCVYMLFNSGTVRSVIFQGQVMPFGSFDNEELIFVFIGSVCSFLMH